jgi:hypothetical protein
MQERLLISAGFLKRISFCRQLKMEFLNNITV